MGEWVDHSARRNVSWHLWRDDGFDREEVKIAVLLDIREELRAQFGRFAESYDLSPARTKSAKVRLIGNSVAPECAEALVRANLPIAAEAVA